MKIVEIKTAVVAYHGNATLIRIDTDVGISGYGEANPDAGAAAIVGLISELKAGTGWGGSHNVEAAGKRSGASTSFPAHNRASF